MADDHSRIDNDEAARGRDRKATERDLASGIRDKFGDPDGDGAADRRYAARDRFAAAEDRRAAQRDRDAARAAREDRGP